MSRVHLTAVSGLGPFRRLCEAAGDRVFAQALRTACVPASLVETPDAMMPLPVMFDLLGEATRLAGDELFGLRLGDGMRPAEFGAWVRYALAGRSLRDAVERSIRTIHVHQPGARLSLSRAGALVAWRYRSAVADTSGCPAHADHVLLPMLKVVRQFAGEAWMPLAFHVPYPRPSHAARLERQLGAKVVFGSSGSGLVFRESVLDLSRPGQDREAAAALGDLRRQMARRNVSTAAGTVASMISFGPDHDGFKLATIARLMMRSTRALQNDLRLEGTTFREVLARVRMEEALMLVTETSLPLSEIAWRLGYSELPHFSRAFSGGTGRPPNDYRRLSRAGPLLRGST